MADPKNQRQVKNEYNIHSSLKHENIVGFIEFFHRRGDLNIILSFCENGSLRHYVKMSQNNLSIHDYQHFVVQILNGVCYMHDQSIIHRDLKCSNLLLDSKMSVKICDFGLAIHANEAKFKSNRICGTLNYMAPEILERKLYSFSSDICYLTCYLGSYHSLILTQNTWKTGLRTLITSKCKLFKKYI